MVNCAEPQSKQIEIVGKVRATPGFWRCLRPGKWIMISAVRSALFADEHKLQHIAFPFLGGNGNSCCFISRGCSLTGITLRNKDLRVKRIVSGCCPHQLVEPSQDQA